MPRHEHFAAHPIEALQERTPEHWRQASGQEPIQEAAKLMNDVTLCLFDSD
jgi:hypothetical protein